MYVIILDGEEVAWVVADDPAQAVGALEPAPDWGVDELIVRALPPEREFTLWSGTEGLEETHMACEWDELHEDDRPFLVAVGDC